MRRWWVFLLVLGVVFALVAPAAAAPGDEAWCADHPDHPKCEAPPNEPDPVGGMPCGGTVETESGFVVELGGRKSGLPDGACVDVMSDRGAWSVQVEVHTGTLRSMTVFIRDSFSPGDGCFPGGSCGLSLRQIPDENPFTLTLGMDDIPGAYVNACNEFLDDNYFGEWAFDALGEWTFFEDIHPELPSPLAFLPSVSGSNDLRVELTVTFPELSD